MLMYIWVWHELNTVTIINQTWPGVKIKQNRHNKSANAKHCRKPKFDRGFS